MMTNIGPTKVYIAGRLVIQQLQVWVLVNVNPVCDLPLIGTVVLMQESSRKGNYW